MDGAYHGHTTTMIDISPYKFMGKGGSGHPKEWVHMVPIPDGYRGPFKGQDREAGVAYGNEVGRIVSSIDDQLPGSLPNHSLPAGDRLFHQLDIWRLRFGTFVLLVGSALWMRFLLDLDAWELTSGGLNCRTLYRILS